MYRIVYDLAICMSYRSVS